MQKFGRSHALLATALPDVARASGDGFFMLSHLRDATHAHSVRSTCLRVAAVLGRSRRRAALRSAALAAASESLC